MKKRAELLKYIQRTQAMHVEAMLSRNGMLTMLGIGDTHCELYALRDLLDANLEEEKRILGITETGQERPKVP